MKRVIFSIEDIARKPNGILKFRVPVPLARDISSKKKGAYSAFYAPFFFGPLNLYKLLNGSSRQKVTYGFFLKCYEDFLEMYKGQSVIVKSNIRFGIGDKQLTRSGLL